MRQGDSSQAGFTIIELMITVAILAVLASVAVMAYSQYVERAHNSEATALLADVRLKQEAYRSTFHQYAFDGVGSGWYPDKTPGDQPRHWGSDQDWNQLGVKPSDPVYFSYYCRAGAPGVAAADANMVSLPDLSSVTGDDFWFVAQAIQDVDGNGDCGGFEIYPGNRAIVTIKDDDGETEKAGFCPP